jgi:predicted glycogen debranching enzyme
VRDPLSLPTAMQTTQRKPLIRSIPLNGRGDLRELLQREWLLTNGLGGYASGTISGSVSRRYHGLLVAALPAPLGRVVMFNHLAEYLHLPDGSQVQIGGEEPPMPSEAGSLPTHHTSEFRIENQLPCWRIEAAGVVVEKRVLLVHGQNTVHVTYKVLSDHDGLRLELRPSFHYRPHENDVASPLDEEYAITIRGKRYKIGAAPPYPPLRLYMYGDRTAFTHDAEGVREIAYQLEAERGYRSRGLLWSPGYFRVCLRPGQDATLVASTESWDTVLALNPDEALVSETVRRQRLVEIAHPSVQEGAAAGLVLAADQFIMTPAGRVEDATRARASGDEIRSIIAGYHWFTDWGRDTMISLEGLTLTSGRHQEARWILRTFAHYVRDGLLPNYFPDGQNEGVYHTADATLWFFHAVDRYLDCTQDRATLRLLLPVLHEIIRKHQQGTRFGIAVDPADGLLKQGAPGYQLTWMDAKVDDWVVTPRRGKAVEINALWYNALRLTEAWLREEGAEAEAAALGEQAARARASFNERFWNPATNHLYDVVDGEQGNDPACRPNQIFSFSLRHPVLDESRWPAVLDTVRDRLLTPVGLRSLSREHPDYKPRYFGDLRARDAAYHQGTVWGWLIGPFIDAHLKVHPEDFAGARGYLDALLPHLDTACVGSISEIFDADPPYTPRGCIAQAWSVAEALRCWAKASGPEKK